MKRNAASIVSREGRGFIRRVGVNHRLKHGRILSARPARQQCFILPRKKIGRKEQVGLCGKFRFNRLI